MFLPRLDIPDHPVPPKIGDFNLNRVGTDVEHRLDVIGDERGLPQHSNILSVDGHLCNVLDRAKVQGQTGVLLESPAVNLK